MDTNAKHTGELTFVNADSSKIVISRSMLGAIVAYVEDGLGKDLCKVESITRWESVGAGMRYYVHFTYENAKGARVEDTLNLGWERKTRSWDICYIAPVEKTEETGKRAYRHYEYPVGVAGDAAAEKKFRREARKAAKAAQPTVEPEVVYSLIPDPSFAE